MEVILIAAIAENYVEGKGYPIGKDGKIPWRIPEDMKRFKELTVGHPVIMGRKTYESIPLKFRPLEDRLNIVLSKNTHYMDGAYIVRSLDDVLSDLEVQWPRIEDLSLNYTKIDYNKVYVIGGGEIYNESIYFANTLEITHVKQKVEDADAFFPKIDLNVWKEDERKDKEGYSFVTYFKKR